MGVGARETFVPVGVPYAMPCCIIFLRNVLRLMPSISEARDWLPPACSSTISSSGFSTQSITMSYMSQQGSSPSRSLKYSLSALRTQRVMSFSFISQLFMLPVPQRNAAVLRAAPAPQKNRLLPPIARQGFPIDSSGGGNVPNRPVLWCTRRYACAPRAVRCVRRRSHTAHAHAPVVHAGSRRLPARANIRRFSGNSRSRETAKGGLAPRGQSSRRPHRYVSAHTWLFPAW